MHTCIKLSFIILGCRFCSSFRFSFLFLLWNNRPYKTLFVQWISNNHFISRVKTDRGFFPHGIFSMYAYTQRDGITRSDTITIATATMMMIVIPSLFAYCKGMNVYRWMLLLRRLLSYTIYKTFLWRFVHRRHIAHAEYIPFK